MSENTEMLSARVPPELKDLVDADNRDNQEVVRAALWREFGGVRKGDLERRIHEKERRIEVVSDEVDDRKNELDELYTELSALKEKYQEKVEEEKETLEEARENLADTPHNPENPAVQNWAEKLELTPEELIEKLDE